MQEPTSSTLIAAATASRLFPDSWETMHSTIHRFIASYKVHEKKGDTAFTIWEVRELDPLLQTYGSTEKTQSKERYRYIQHI